VWYNNWGWLSSVYEAKQSPFIMAIIIAIVGLCIGVYMGQPKFGKQKEQFILYVLELWATIGTLDEKGRTSKINCTQQGVFSAMLAEEYILIDISLLAASWWATFFFATSIEVYSASAFLFIFSLPG